MSPRLVVDSIVTESADVIEGSISEPRLGRGDRVLGFDAMAPNNPAGVQRGELRDGLARPRFSVRGADVRCLAPIRSTVRGIARSADVKSTGEVYNLGRGLPVGLIDAVEAIRRVTGKPVRIRCRPLPPGSLRATPADTCRAPWTFGFRPRVEFEGGLARQCAWHCGRPVTKGAARAGGSGTNPVLGAGEPA